MLRHEGKHMSGFENLTCLLITIPVNNQQAIYLIV